MASWGRPRGSRGAPGAAQNSQGGATGRPGDFSAHQDIFLGFFEPHGTSRKSQKWTRNVWVYKQWQAGVVFEDAMAPPKSPRGRHTVYFGENAPLRGAFAMGIQMFFFTARVVFEDAMTPPRAAQGIPGNPWKSGPICPAGKFLGLKK